MRKLIAILLISLVALPVYAGSTSRPYTDGAVNNYLQTTSDTIGNPNAVFEGDGSNLSGIEGGGSVTAVAADIPGCIQPGGFQLAHNDVNGDSVITAETGGVICASTPDGSYYEQVVLDNGDTMDLDVDLINGSTRNPSQWYELVVIADSDGVEPARLVAYDSTSTPQTSTDLPTDYELFASLSQPRSGWVRTDGSSALYEQDWTGSGYLPGKTWCENNSVINSQTTSPPTTWTGIDVSGFVPPVKSSIKIQNGRFRATQGNWLRVGLSSRQFSTATHDNSEISLMGYAAANPDWQNVLGTLSMVENQTIFWAVTGNESELSNFDINTISYVEVTGE